jgi:hypothetical protein
MVSSQLHVSALYILQKSLGIHWLAPVLVWLVLKREKISCLCHESNPDSC